jgi:hypothetical protein
VKAGVVDDQEIGFWGCALPAAHSGVALDVALLMLLALAKLRGVPLIK